MFSPWHICSSEKTHCLIHIIDGEGKAQLVFLCKMGLMVEASSELPRVEPPLIESTLLELGAYEHRWRVNFLEISCIVSSMRGYIWWNELHIRSMKGQSWWNQFGVRIREGSKGSNWMKNRQPTRISGKQHNRGELGWLHRYWVVQTT